MKEATPKDNAIRWMNALNGATTIVSAMIQKGDVDIEKNIKDIADYLYEIEPSTTELEDNIENAKTSQELDSLKDQVVKSDSVKLFSAWNNKKIKLGA